MAQCEDKCPFCKRPQVIRVIGNINNCLGGRWYGHTCTVCGCRYKVFIEAVLTTKNHAIFRDGKTKHSPEKLQKLAETIRRT